MFLETHHVIALSEGGPDVEWNVVAICPNDHRRAHYGEDRIALRKRLIAVLVVQFPEKMDALATINQSGMHRSP